MVLQGMQHGTSMGRARLDHCFALCALRFALCTLRFSRCALHVALGTTDLLPHRADVHVLPLVADLIEVGKP